MPTEFLMETIAKNELNPAGDSSRDSVRLRMAYDGSGRRVSKTRERKTETGDWIRESVMHYTGIGTEVRENYSEGSFQDARVVVNMPHGLGRYGVENATAQNVASDFEWYLKNHLGSTMLVYGTGDGAGSVKAAYDYRAFGEQVDLAVPAEKVTENFTGKERDDETELNYFGARYLDPMLGLWTSVDPKRQFASPYLYVGNGMNPLNAIDPDGNYTIYQNGSEYSYRFSSWQETLMFQYYQNFIPFGTLIEHLTRSDNVVEGSNISNEPMTLLSVAVDGISVLKMLKALVIAPKLEKTFEQSQYLNQGLTIKDAVKSAPFESYMDKLTLFTSIRGPSIDDVKAKASWAEEYGRNLYNNDVEITNEVRHTFDKAYREQFEGQDE